MKYVLCRPEGGLNDQFNQIAKCLSYARRFGRSLIIDTAICGFGESHRHYFVPRDGIIINDAEVIRDVLSANSHSVFPIAPRQSCFAYRFRYDDAVGNFVTDPEGLVLSFDFSRDYEEKVLVHHACGGGFDGINALTDFKLADAIREIFFVRRRSLPDVYFGLHVRNTDYKTEFEGAFRAIADNEVFVSRKIPIYLASDDPSVVSLARKVFPVEVYNFSHLPVVERNLHTTDLLPKPVVNIDALCDLALLSVANGFFAPKMVQGSYSGFSVLVAQFRERPDALRAFIGR